MNIRAARKVFKIGNSLAVTIPAKEAQLFDIQVGSKVTYEMTKLPFDTANETPRTEQQEFEEYLDREYAKMLARGFKR